MVATLSQIASSQAAELYYIANQASERHAADYYNPGKEPDGVWVNPHGLFGLADGGKVDAGDFHRLFRGFSPLDEKHRLVRNAGKASRSAGVDVTFSPDKTVSALWAIADPGLRAKIERAHNEAAREALERFAFGECGHTRRRIGGAGPIEAVPADLVAAMFQHGESREQDPQLHTHCVVFNVARTRDDGKYRAHHQKPVYWWKLTMAAWYRAALAAKLQRRLGVRMERYGRDDAFTRIVGIPEALVSRWSRRTGQIQAWAAEQGVSLADSPALAQAATLLTRKYKSSLDTREADYERWLGEASGIVPDVAQIVRDACGHETRVEPEEIRALTESLLAVPHALTRYEAVVRMPKVVEAIANRCAGLVDVPAIETAVRRVLRDPALIALRPRPTADAAAGLAHTRVWTTAHTLKTERAVTDMAERMKADTGYGVPAAAVEDKLEALRERGYPLSGEQAAAIRAAAGSDGRIHIVEGAAGSGKTTTLRPLADLWREHGRTIVPTAVAWRTAIALGTDVAARPYSVAAVLEMASREKLDAGRDTVIVVDEAGMLSTRQIHHLMRLSERTGAKVLFCGDTQQLQPVEAGPGLRLARDVVGSSRIETMRRQKADAEDVLVHVRGMKPAAARRRAAAMTPAARERVVADYEAMPAETRPAFRPWQIAASEAFRDGRAREAIDAYRARGRFHLCRNTDAAIRGLTADWWRFVRENPGRTSVVLARTNAERRALSLRMRHHVLGEDHLGGKKRVRHVVMVSDRNDPKRLVELEIAVGDRLRIGATHPEKMLFNGTVVIVDGLATIAAAGADEPGLRIDGHTEDGRRVSFRHDEIRDFFGNVRLDHGYAMTIASAQGVTVDETFLLADSRLARESIYSAATRHRGALNVYHDRNALALEVAAQRPDADKRDHDPTDGEILEHLATLQSQARPKEAAHDYDLLEPWAPGVHTPGAEGPANDNAVARLVAEDRERALDLRYGAAVAAFARGRAEVLESYRGLRARMDAGEDVALGPALRETVRRHAVLVTAAEPFRTHPRKFAKLLKARGGLVNDDLQAFRKRLGRVREWRRARAISAATVGRPKASRRPSASEQYPEFAADVKATLARLNVEAGQRQKAVHAQYVGAPGRFAQFVADLETSARRYEAIQAAAADAGNSVDRHPDYPGWRAEAERLETFAGETVAASPGYNRHLNENPRLLTDVRAGLDRMRSDVRRGARAEARTEYRQFLGDWNAMRAEALRSGVHPFYQPGYPAMQERMEALLARQHLPDDIRDAMAELTRGAALYAECRDAVQDLDERLGAHVDAGEAILDEAGRHGGRVEAHPAWPGWRAAANAMRDEAAAMFADTDAYAVLFVSLPESRARIEAGLGQLRETAGHAARLEGQALYRELAGDWKAMHDEARVTGVHPFYQPGYPAMVERAEAFATREHVPDRIRDEIAGFLRDHAVHAERRDAVRSLDARLEAHFDARGAILDEAIAGRFEEREHPDHAAWTLGAAALAAEASAMLEDTETYGIHLDARLDLRIRIESNASLFESHREFDRKRAPLPARSPAPGPATRIEPEPEEPAIDPDIDPGPGIGF